MRRGLYCCLFAAAGAGFAVGAPAPKPPPDYWRPVKGVVTDGKALTCALRGREAVVPCFARLPDGEEVDLPPSASAWGIPLTWNAGRGCLWSATGFSRGGRFDPRKPLYRGVEDRLQRYSLDDLWKGKLMSGPGVEEGKPDDIWFAGSVEPLVGARLAGHYIHVKGYFVGFDYLPAGETSVDLFVLENGTVPPKDGGKFNEIDENLEEPLWTLTAYRFSATWDDTPPKGWGHFVEDRLETIEVGFHDHFQVLEQGGDYYFLTDGGRLYRAPKPDKKGKPRKMECVWQDDKRPIVGLVSDADAGRSFLFCKPEKKGEKGVYFEASAKPEPVEYDPSKVHAATMEDPLPAILDYARILLADKKIQDAKPKD
jgi:hypothetical protein